MIFNDFYFAFHSAFFSSYLLLFLPLFVLLNKVETITLQKFIKIRCTVRKTRIFPQGTAASILIK